MSVSPAIFFPSRQLSIDRLNLVRLYSFVSLVLGFFFSAGIVYVFGWKMTKFRNSIQFQSSSRLIQESRLLYQLGGPFRKAYKRVWEHRLEVCIILLLFLPLALSYLASKMKYSTAEYPTKMALLSKHSSKPACYKRHSNKQNSCKSKVCLCACSNYIMVLMYLR